MFEQASSDVTGGDSATEVIAVFDSGFGGLNILEALRDLLPFEHFIYLGDSKRSPYGDRDPSDVTQFSLEILRYLQANYRLKLVVVACNTASAIALETLKTESEVPIVGVIDAAVRAISRATQNSRVGVVGTVATIGSGVYQRRLAGQAVTAVACPGVVEYVEAGALDDPRLMELLQSLMGPIKEAEVDTLLLACTHYPYLGAQFREVLGEGVVLISSGEETAFEVRELLVDTEPTENKPEIRGKVEFLCTGSVVDFLEVGRRLFHGDLESVHHIEVGVQETTMVEQGASSWSQVGPREEKERVSGQAS